MDQACYLAFRIAVVEEEVLVVVEFFLVVPGEELDAVVDGIVVAVVGIVEDAVVVSVELVLPS
mgnify:CR=1 FL=1